jgi:FAD/FMN-containing dehydrogenase
MNAPQGETAALDRALAEILGPRHAQRSRAALAAAGADEPRAPTWVLSPASAGEISELVRLAAAHRIAVVPVGAGGRTSHAEALRHRTTFLIDTRRLNHVIHLDETSLVVQVQAGLTGLALERILQPRGLSIGDYAPAALRSTIGGILAVRTPGKTCPRHGLIEDAVLGISAVLADGRHVHTRVAPRRASGPDLARALCGSEGTLGIITSAVLRIHRRAEARFLSAHGLPSFAAAAQAVHLALREEALPAAICVYDAAEAAQLLGSALCRDELWGPGAPPAGERAVLVVATAGPSDLAACDRDLVASAAEALGGRALPPEIAERWWQCRELPEAVPGAACLQVTSTPGREAAIHRAMRTAAQRHGAAVRAHAARFDCDGSVLFCTLHRPGEPTALLPAPAHPALHEAVEAAAHEAGAIPTATAPESLTAYFEALRSQLDPQRILNPAVQF